MVNVSTPEQTRRSPWRQPWLLITIGLFIAAAAFGIVRGLTSDASTNDRGDISTAERTCKDSVLERLKSPGSAQFGQPATTRSAGETADFYTVSGTVDSQNGFGALLRSTYTCKLVAERDGTWRVNDLTLSGR